ncbi:hypothetical protein [Deefgea rivuli]|uniref:hypothetical protein n=1 Tax=Deefgea rivuli TaxID=400948 RepID=UPI0004827905|nr:hypothetical protein [Deefgea rivuli]
MFRKSLITAIATGLLLPSIANAEIIDDLLNINDILGNLCGQRMTVLWVDETEQIGPCLLTYSVGCVEVQTAGSQSCSNAAETAKPEAEPMQVTTITAN